MIIKLKFLGDNYFFLWLFFCFKVCLLVYKDNKEVVYVVFDSMGKSRNDWLDCGWIIEFSYIDIIIVIKNYCEMK